MTHFRAIAAMPGTEPRPRDFAGRFVRGGRRHARRRRRQRSILAAGLLAAIALPALAEPGSWGRLGAAGAAIPYVGAMNARDLTQSVLPMPFERKGGSFPGSAYYYLQAEPAAQPSVAIQPPANALADLASAVARPFRFAGTALDRARAQQCMTMAIYYEAATEPDAGQRAVAQVVLNRVAHPAYPRTVCGVVFEGSERPTGCQFTFACDGSLARAPQRFFWNRAATAARAALAGYVYAPVGLATHYHTLQVSPYWAPSLRYVTTIGAHRFYGFAGAGAAPAAFSLAYSGGEPVAAPHPRDLSAATAMANAALDPVMLQHAFAMPAAPAPAQTTSAFQPGREPGPSVPPVLYAEQVRARGGDALYRARELPGAQAIRPEYANSGRWIADPGS